MSHIVRSERTSRLPACTNNSLQCIIRKHNLVFKTYDPKTLKLTVEPTGNITAINTETVRCMK